LGISFYSKFDFEPTDADVVTLNDIYIMSFLPAIIYEMELQAGVSTSYIVVVFVEQRQKERFSRIERFGGDFVTLSSKVLR
jgi:hypothetical protein